jgi:hypothetical protein
MAVEKCTEGRLRCMHGWKSIDRVGKKVRLMRDQTTA